MLSNDGLIDVGVGPAVSSKRYCMLLVEREVGSVNGVGFALTSKGLSSFDLMGFHEATGPLSSLIAPLLLLPTRSCSLLDGSARGVFRIYFSSSILESRVKLLGKTSPPVEAH